MHYYTEYKDWWMPQVQEIKVDKNREKGGTSNSTTATISLNNEKVAFCVVYPFITYYLIYLSIKTNLIIYVVVVI